MQTQTLLSGRGCSHCKPSLAQARQGQLAQAQVRRARSIVTKAQDDDLVTRWVGKIFGQKVINDPKPFGLDRVDWSKIPDQYVVMDRDAEPVETDDAEMKLIRPMLAGTQLEQETLRCAYDANADGWDGSVFHSKVDGYGATIIAAVTEGGALVGGYNPSGYDGFGEKATNGAFLFSWPDGDTSKPPLKLPKVETPQLAIIDRMNQGPQFGPGDLRIPLSRTDPTLAKSKLIDYKKLPGNKKSIFGPNDPANGTTSLVELRAYVRKGGKLKYELDGLRWKSSYTEEGDDSGKGPPSGIMFF